jgi:ribose transport system substrate-binding protein
MTNCRRDARRTIGVIPKADADQFFVTLHAGAEQAARQFHISMSWNGPDKETDYSRQIQIVDVMIARRVDAIAISATDQRALIAPLERATQASIPITIFDSAVDIENYVSMVATDNFGAGCAAARLLAGLLPRGGKIAMVMQKPGGTSTELREQGFVETVTKEFPLLKIVARQFGLGDREKSMAVAENFLTAFPDLAGIFASSEASSIGAIRAIRARGLSVRPRLVTFDVSEIHLEALRDGTADFMMVQDAFRIGYEAVKSLVDKLSGRTPAHRLDIPARIVAKADLDKPEMQHLLHPPQIK